MEVTLKNGKLVIEIGVNDPLTPSGSGKTMQVASTHGNMRTNVEVNGMPLFVGLNAYVYPPDKQFKKGR